MPGFFAACNILRINIISQHPAFSPNASWDDIWPTVGESGLIYEHVPVRFRIAARGHSWEVCRNTAFWGIFQSRAEANDTVKRAMNDIFATGGSAQMRFA